MTIEEAEKQYNEYLEGHISNVQEALELLNTLDIQFVKDNYDELKTICQEHDASKYSEEEYIPYREHFYPINDEEKLKTEAFEQACRHHIKTNKHHWDYWVNDDNELEIPDEQEYKLYCVERCCDWLAMSCQHDEVSNGWYNANKESIIMPDYGWELCDEIMSKVPEKCDFSFKGTRGELDESNLLDKLDARIEDDNSDKKAVAYYKNKILKGEHRPILISKDNEVIDGNHTVTAYKELGIEPENVYIGTSEDFLKTAADIIKDRKSSNPGLDAIYKMIDDGTAVLAESINSAITKNIATDVALKFGWHIEDGSKKTEFLVVTNKNNIKIGKIYFTYPSSISIYIFGKKQVLNVPNDYDRSDYSYEQFINNCEQVIKGMINREKQTKQPEKDKAKSPEQLQLDLFESMSYKEKKDVMIQLIMDADKEGIQDVMYQLSQIDIIPDDKRRGGKKFIIDAINNLYTLEPMRKSNERDNLNIENAICNGLHKDSEEYLDHEPFSLNESFNIIRGDKGYLLEASMKQLKRKTLSEDPTRAKKSKHVQSKYIGISKYGVLNFETTSETYSGVTWYQEVHFPSFTGFMNIVEQGDEIEAEDVKKAMSSDNIKISCDDPSFLYWAWKYMAWKDVYGLEKETRAPKRNNTRLRGGLCKHLYSVIELLNEKRIVDLVTRDLNQFCKMKLGITNDGYQDAEGMMKKDFKANQYDYNVEDILKDLLSKENYQKYIDGTPLEDLGLSDKEMADIDKAIQGMRSAGQYALKSELEKEFEPVKRGRKIKRDDIKLKVGNDEEEEGK